MQVPGYFGILKTVNDIAPKSTFLPRATYFDTEAHYWELIDIINTKILRAYEAANPKPKVDPNAPMSVFSPIGEWGLMRLNWLRAYLADQKQYDEWVYWAQGQSRTSTSFATRVGGWLAQAGAITGVAAGAAVVAPAVAGAASAPSITLPSLAVPSLPSLGTAATGAVALAGDKLQEQAESYIDNLVNPDQEQAEPAPGAPVSSVKAAAPASSIKSGFLELLPVLLGVTALIFL